MPQFFRYFTPEEANALLPWIRSVFAQVHQILEAVAPEISSSGQAASGNASPGNGHGRPSGEEHPPWADLSHQGKIALIDQLLGTVAEAGIIIQDVERGLIDFPANRQGRELLLCYELNDGPQLRFWHEIEDGYAGRQPIEQLPPPGPRP